jgi:ribosomal-protein-alanine N-acetyltransferase
VGFCGLRQFSKAEIVEAQVEILYGISPDHWGKGLAVEAASAVLRFGFERLQLARFMQALICPMPLISRDGEIGHAVRSSSATAWA